MKQTISIPTAPSSTLCLHTVFLLAIFLTACSVFKARSFSQADSLHEQDARRETSYKESTQVNALRVYHHQDSSESQSFTEIFPDGPFNYSAKEGFLGNAKLVTINKRLKEGSKAKDSATINRKKNTLLHIGESERSLTKSGLKEKTEVTRNYIPFYLGGVILIFAAVFFLRLKLDD